MLENNMDAEQIRQALDKQGMNQEELMKLLIYAVVLVASEIELSNNPYGDQT